MKKLYTFNELKKKFNWTIDEYLRPQEKIQYAKQHGINIAREEGNSAQRSFYILDEEEFFTQKEILKFYPELNRNYVIPNFVNFAKKRGLILELQNNTKSPQLFKIIDDTILKQHWEKYIYDDSFEVSKNGYVRKADSQLIIGSKTTYGYMQVKQKDTFLLVHRMIMETFNPIENSNEMYVDHINGIRDDNRLENLRWVNHLDNQIYKEKNWDRYKNIFSQLLYKYGYEGLETILKKILNEDITI